MACVEILRLRVTDSSCLTGICPDDPVKPINQRVSLYERLQKVAQITASSLSGLRSFHMLQPEIVEVCDGIGFSP